MEYTFALQEVLQKAFALAEKMRHRFLMPEHLVYGLSHDREFADAFMAGGGDLQKLRQDLSQYLEEYGEQLAEGQAEAMLTNDFQQVLWLAEGQAHSSSRNAIEVSHVFAAILTLEDSWAVYYLMVQEVDLIELLGDLSRNSIARDPEIEHLNQDSSMQDDKLPEDGWRRYVDCLNDICMQKNPLIGREKEIERTIQILCRMDKNNVIHVGEPGVGKTAITYGLARRIVQNDVPAPLQGARIYAMDMSMLLAGTQYRGDFEKRFKIIMDGLSQEKNPIVYLDEIHNIVGAGAVNGGSLDVSNLLKPYLAEGKIRFIGATTYEEYKKHFAVSKSLERRFQKVDIAEPTEAETVAILKGLKPRYEKFHGVKYGKDVIEYAVAVSKKYINERFLPDKAIDLIDEAGAYRRLHPLSQKAQTVNKQLIDDVLSQTCNIPKQLVEQDEIIQLADLEVRLKQKVFGQQEAITQVCHTVKFAKAGLNEDGKPLASYLFVGPTGVGKTETARALAEELNIAFVRFDMSEYAERHAVAKLIGAPAGYVGYEEGGLLTEEIRKHPHAVLLLDEIEKAHPDIFNVLLQVMDYATLTDNQGRKADFRNVILIMTSNAGASEVGKNAVGFGSEPWNQDAIREAVKRTFQPEFRNRLNRIVLFSPMDNWMAEQITKKKLEILSQKLTEKKVAVTFTDTAIQHIKQAGITNEYGAREIDRVIEAEVKPLLVDELLFGRLKKGGQCMVDEKEGTLRLC